jgi:uncharacterized SAM-dependent methyltransferase
MIARELRQIFNKNILNAINIIVETDFNVADFEHYAFFNEKKSRIEMHLIAQKDVVVNSPYFKKENFNQKGRKHSYRKFE